jgi:hypothetical protein
MASLNRTARNFTLVVLTGLVFVSASRVSLQSKASWPKESSAIRIKYQQERGTVRPTTQPLLDWLARANDLKLRGQLDLNSSSEFTVDAKLNTNCRLSDIVVSQKSGDRRLFEVVGSLVAALGDAGLLTFVGDREQHEFSDTACVQMPLRFNFSTDPSEFAASIEYPTASAQQATMLARAYNVLIKVGRDARRGRTDELILNAMTAAANDSQIIVRFRASRTAVDEIIGHLLADPKT